MKLPFGRVAFLGVFLAVVGFAFYALRGPRGFPALLDINRQIDTRETHNLELAQRVERLRDRINHLESDPATLELEIRKRLKLMRKGERIYIAPSPKE
jgi:cell division protein FtsB